MPINFCGFETQAPILLFLEISGNFFKSFYFINSIVLLFMVVGFKSSIIDDKSLIVPSLSIIEGFSSFKFPTLNNFIAGILAVPRGIEPLFHG